MTYHYTPVDPSCSVYLRRNPMGHATSPFLKQVSDKFGVTPESLLDRWNAVLDQVAHVEETCHIEDLSADGYKTAQEYLEQELLDEIENDPLNPAKFIESRLDARSYIETVFIQSSPEGQDVTDDEGKTKLLTNPAAGFKAAGLMAPGGSVGEDVEDETDESLQDLTPDTAAQPINSSVDARIVESVFDDEALARQAALLADSVSLGGPNGRR
jgi:hypothetical protein